MTRIPRLQILRADCNRQHVRRLRSRMTDAEWWLWYRLRARRFFGLGFRRQVPMGHYVVDFVCEQSSLIVELDGGQHADALRKDAERTRWLEERGYRVIRFWNNDVLENIEGVLEAIAGALNLSLPDPPPRGREKV